MQFLSIFLCALFALTVSATPFIATSYVVLSETTLRGYTYSGYSTTYTDPESVATRTRYIAKPTGTVAALSTISRAAGFASDVTMVLEVFASGSPTTSTTESRSLDYTSYYVPVTYTPDATCKRQTWTFSTNVPVTVPATFTPTPVSVMTSSTTIPVGNGAYPIRTFLAAILNPTDVAAEQISSASSNNMPYYMTYCYTPTTSCYTPVGTATIQCTPTFAFDRSTSRGGSRYYDDYYSNHYLTPLILICVLVPVGWFLIWLFLGLFESWLSFKGLMLGQHRKRGLPYAWCCISIIFLCWTGPTYKAKSPEEQAILLERWKEMKAGEKFKLWMKWGFRWKYPTMLGEAPPIAKRALRQGCL